MNLPCLRGIELRYMLAFHLANQGPATVGELIDAVNHQGFSFRGRPNTGFTNA
jgi:hypothetical protein